MNDIRELTAAELDEELRDLSSKELDAVSGGFFGVILKDIENRYQADAARTFKQALQTAAGL